MRLTQLRLLRTWPFQVKETNTAQIARSYPAIRIPVFARQFEKQYPIIPQRRGKQRKQIQELFLLERVILDGDDARYTQVLAERLIGEALQHGQEDEKTIAVLDAWLQTQKLVDKTFDVFVPRFQKHKGSYTSIYRAAPKYGVEPKNIINRDRIVVELKGNPFPSLEPFKVRRAGWIHNVLLRAAEDRKKQNEKL